MNINDPIPVRMYTKEALKLAGVSHSKWKEMIEKGEAPAHKYRGKGGFVWLGMDMAEFLGLVDKKEGISDDDPFIKGAERLGKIKGR